jgi:hypothetical protein
VTTERRRNRRLPTSSAIRLWLSNDTCVTGRTSDASAAGLRVTLDRAAPGLKAGDRCRLEVEAAEGAARALAVEVRHVNRRLIGLRLLESASAGGANGVDSRRPRDATTSLALARSADGADSRARLGLRRSRVAEVGEPVQLHFPLSEARLCCDCDRVFSQGQAACPACGNPHFVLLANLLDRASLLARPPRPA